MRSAPQSKAAPVMGLQTKALSWQLMAHGATSPHCAPHQPPPSVPSPRAPCSRGAAFCGAAPSQHCYVHSPIPTHANMDSTPCTCGMWGAGCRVQNVGCRMGHAGQGMQDGGCRMGDAGRGMHAAGSSQCSLQGREQHRGCSTRAAQRTVPKMHFLSCSSSSSTAVWGADAAATLQLSL